MLAQFRQAAGMMDPRLHLMARPVLSAKENRAASVDVSQVEPKEANILATIVPSLVANQSCKSS